jgi:carbon monoxide dehydrogenase subunit G
MWFEMRREDLGFVGRAPLVHAAEARVGASRADVFRALVDPGGWPDWFPGVRAASYQTRPPYEVGTVRVADVRRTRWVEEIIAWDVDRRWAWTVVRASVPLARAQVESFELTDDGGGTRIRWTLALEPRLIARLGAPFMARTISRLLARAMRNLEARLRLPAPLPH